MADSPRIGGLARQDVPTCRLTERIGDVQERVRAAGGNECVVVNEERVVLGLLRGEAWSSGPQAVVEEVMESGPTTFRPHLSLEGVMKYLETRKTDSILVTTSDGQLVGILYRKDLTPHGQLPGATP